jgi:integrase
MRIVKLTSEWIASWKPRKQEEITDGVCRGLLLRGGPSGSRAFYYWTDTRDPETGKARRKRVKLARWALDGGGGALSLSAAREAFIALQATKRAEVDGTAQHTVKDLADAYRRDILSHRRPLSAAWSWGIVSTHVLSAVPNRKRPAFSEWPVCTVRPPDIATLVRNAREIRTVKTPGKNGKTVLRKVGGPAVARATLHELKAIFANAVGTGALEMSPAAVLESAAFGLRKPKRKRYLDAKELEALFHALDLNAILAGNAKRQKLSETVRLGIALLFYAPVRSHSLVAAEWKEIDLDAARWVIPVAKLKLHPDERAEDRPFTVPLPETAVAILRKLKALASTSPWVLASPKDPKKHIAPKVLVRALARLQESGRLALAARFTIHDARRTWRRWAGELGISFEVAEKSLAHTLPGVADTYARAEMVEQRAQAAGLVAAALDRIRLDVAAQVVPLREREA